MTDILIDVRNVHLRQGRRVLVEGVTLTLRRGRALTVIGPNGGGKTTLLRLLIGERTPTEGVIRRTAGVRIGYMPQRLNLEPTLPLLVDDFLALGGGTRRQDRRAVLDRVGMPWLASASMADLSGGELQRALLARALLRRPDLLLLDEPTQALDQNGEADFYGLIQEVRRETGCGVLMVSHDLHVVMASSDEVLCLNGGVCCHGVPAQVAADPSYQELFGDGSRGMLALYQHHHHHRHDSSPTSASTIGGARERDEASLSDREQTDA